jgi:hypothetical protein
VVLNGLFVDLALEADLDGTQDIRQAVRTVLTDWSQQDKDLVSWCIRQELHVIWSVFVMARHKDIHDFVQELLG